MLASRASAGYDRHSLRCIRSHHGRADETFAYFDAVERDGLSMTFQSQNRPIESYFSALEEAGLLIEALREPRVPDRVLKSDRGRRWQRVPLFLHLPARRP
jgi:hypothetical protein